MTGIVTKRFRLHNALHFKEAFSEANNVNMYMAIGRSFSWDNDSNPPEPEDSISNTDYEIWQSLYSAKKIDTNDVSFVTPRIDWIANTVYQEYTDKIDLENKNYYVLTNDNNVYKCLFNNSDNPSTVKPTGTSTANIRTSDNYIWKYMFTVSAADALKFLTPNYMPLKRLESDDGSAQWTVQQAASNGSIDVIDVIDGGKNYKVSTGVFKSVSNSTHMEIANTASTTDNIFNGSGLYIDGGSGSGQLREIIDYDGGTRQVVLRSPLTVTPSTSSSYLISPLITVNGDGKNATAYANVVSGGINQINVIDSGRDYSYAKINISANTGSGAIAVPYISPKGGHGSDPVRELNGHNILLFNEFEGNESNTIPDNISIRQIALISNPLNSNGTYANSLNYDLSTKFTLDSINGSFNVNEIIDGNKSESTGLVLSYANNTLDTGSMKVTDTRPKFNVGETITGNTSGATANVKSITSSELKFGSGEVLYIENRTPIIRSTDQTEDVKLIVKF